MSLRLGVKMNGQTPFTYGAGISDGLRAGTLNSAQFSDGGMGGLPDSFGHYRPPNTFSQGDGTGTSQFPHDGDQRFDGHPEVPESSHFNGQEQTPHATGPDIPVSQGYGPSLHTPGPFPPSATNQPRPKDLVQQALVESMGGNDEVAALHTTVIKERPVGLEPHMASQARQEKSADDDGGTYEGAFNQAGQRHGNGKCLYKDGGEYEGEWERGKRHGRGTMTYRTKAVYVGEWDQGERSGHGVMTYRDQRSSYEGQWLRDLKHGYGFFRFQSGAEYTGQFFEGKMHGQGTYTYADEQQHLGEFERGLKHGFGTHHYTTKDRWDGVWVSDQPHGFGTYYYNNSDKKVECAFRVEGDERPQAGAGAPGQRALRKEDKLRLVKEGLEMARLADETAAAAEGKAALARRKADEIMESTANFLGVR